MKGSKSSNKSSDEENEPMTYKCTKCGKIPSVKIQPNCSLEVKCNCDNNKKRKTTIDDFMENMTTQEKEKLLCEGEHKKLITALFHCEECKSKMCLSCLLNHNQDEENMDHHTCLVGQNNKEYMCCLCKSEEEEVSFYCSTCGLQICRNCYEKHKEEKDDHIILEITELLEKENYAHFKEQLDKFSSRLEEDRKYAEQMMEKMENCYVQHPQT